MGESSESPNDDSSDEGNGGAILNRHRSRNNDNININEESDPLHNMELDDYGVDDYMNDEEEDDEEEEYLE